MRPQRQVRVTSIGAAWGRQLGERIEKAGRAKAPALPLGSQYERVPPLRPKQKVMFRPVPSGRRPAPAGGLWPPLRRGAIKAGGPMGRLPLSGGDAEQSEAEGVGIIGPYRHVANLSRRAHTMRPYRVTGSGCGAKPRGYCLPGARTVGAGTNPHCPPSGSGRDLSPVLNGTAPLGGAALPEGIRRKVLETLVSKRRFAYFADAGKVGRPQAKPPHPPSPVKFLIHKVPVPPAGDKSTSRRR